MRPYNPRLASDVARLLATKTLETSFKAIAEDMLTLRLTL